MRREASKLSISFGLNILDNNGDRNPFSILSNTKDIAFSIPFDFTIGYELNDRLEVFMSTSFNRFKKGQSIDGIRLDESLNYTALDVGLRFYAIHYEISRASDVALFIHTGAGLYKITEAQATFNLGMGIMYNITSEIGVYGISTAKFSLANEVYKSNLFQHGIGVRLRIFNSVFRKCNCSSF